ncbi:MAG: hypothetical protein IT182_00300 [Acidobacteria bacterium]|nr:hypothetical protein [Acidobacteriota bacterium]
MTKDEGALERQVQRALAALPPPRAPRTLRPRVMAAVTPVVGRPWFTWPWPVQVAAATALCLVVGVLVWQWPALVAAIAPSLPAPVHEGTTRVVALAEANHALMKLLQLTWTGVVAPVARFALVISVLLCTACAVCLAALSRVALGGASQS